MPFASVDEDLKRIPKRGTGLNQSNLRQCYNAQRRANLGKDGSHCSRGESLSQVLNAIRKSPDDVFLYDEEYFAD